MLDEAALEAKRKTEEMEVELVRREKLLFVEKLVKGLAHEIFNPLQPVVQYVDRLNQVFVELFTICDEFKYEIPEDRRREMLEQFDLFREATTTIEERIDHLFRVVDTLSQMSRADDQSIKPIDFKAYWTNAVNVIQAQTHGDTLEEVPVEEDISPNLPPVVANAVQLTQVFLNLYRNAIHAMDGKSEKLVSVKAWVDPQKADFLTISFSDTGGGIPPDMIPRVFDFGFSTKGEKGQGIGLYMCKVIVERFGGSIVCQSKAGKGTVFLIRLPISKERKPVA
jgi:signal transduction histidine kinase